MAYSNIVLIVLLVCCLLAVPSSAQQTGLQLYGRFELTLVSGKTYMHPHRDVRIWCEFTSPTGREYRHEGYWNGGNDYRVRFAPQEAGQWRYRTSCSDTTNGRLRGISGEFTVEPYSGDEAFRAKGWLKVSDNGRYLTYGDGTPFFYLADTDWELAWMSRLPEVRPYLADRRRKGFTALQICTMSMIYLPPPGVSNRNGEPVFLDNDFSMLNPRYFDYLDSLIGEVNDSGMIAMIVPLWGNMNEQFAFHEYHRRVLTNEQTRLLNHYIGARYGGYNVAWIVTTDEKYDTPERQRFWAEIAQTLKNAGGWNHLATLHPTARRGTFDDFGEEADWLDFYMYQAPHSVGTDFTWQGAAMGFCNTNSLKPVICGEMPYEDFYNNLPTRIDPGAFRIAARHIRQAGYESLLAGSTGGITYGANGIWQWSIPERMGLLFPRYTWDSAMHLPGSEHIGVLRKLMVDHQWYNLRSRQDLIAGPVTSRENYIPIAGDSTRLLVYLPMWTTSVPVNLAAIGRRVTGYWINPSTGDTAHSVDITEAEGLDRFTLTPPDTSDWLFVAISREPPVEIVRLPGSPIFHVLSLAPNPCRGRICLYFTLEEPGELTVRWWDMLGRPVGFQQHSVSEGLREVIISGLGMGAYYLTCTYTSKEGRSEVWETKVVSAK
jgi:hypothetical protein